MKYAAITRDGVIRRVFADAVSAGRAVANHYKACTVVEVYDHIGPSPEPQMTPDEIKLNQVFDFHGSLYGDDR